MTIQFCILVVCPVTLDIIQYQFSKSWLNPEIAEVWNNVRRSNKIRKKSGKDTI